MFCQLFSMICSLKQKTASILVELRMTMDIYFDYSRLQNMQDRRLTNWIYSSFPFSKCIFKQNNRAHVVKSLKLWLSRTKKMFQLPYQPYLANKLTWVVELKYGGLKDSLIRRLVFLPIYLKNAKAFFSSKFHN